MNRGIAALAAAAALTLGPAARAETRSSTDLPRFGLGIAFEPLGLAATQLGGQIDLLSPPATFFVPVNVTGKVRIEPALGYFHVSQDRNVAGTNPFSATATAVGLGGLYFFAPPSPLGVYAGARLSLVFHSRSTFDAGTGQSSDHTSTDFVAAPVFGGEFVFAQRFGVGGEVQLPLSFYGNETTTTTAAGQTTTQTTNLNRSGFSISPVLFLRYFFL